MCATLGAGITSACVVDIGDQKTSVCCVEDGLSQKNTRSAYLLICTMTTNNRCANKREGAYERCLKGRASTLEYYVT